MIIEEARKGGAVKLLPDNVRVYSRSNPLAPKIPEGRRNFPPLTIGTVLIRLNRPEVSKELLHWQNH
jgi:hypothetical protein